MPYWRTPFHFEPWYHCAIVFLTVAPYRDSITSKQLTFAWWLSGWLGRWIRAGPRGHEFDSRQLRFQVTRSTQPSIPPG